MIVIVRLCVAKAVLTPLLERTVIHFSVTSCPAAAPAFSAMLFNTVGVIVAPVLKLLLSEA